MKKTLKWLVPLALLVLIFSACGNTAEESKTPQTDTKAGSKYVFVYNNVKLPMNAEFGPLLKQLGEADSYFEAASCAFNGLDKVYTYKGLEINTYPNEENKEIDYISSIRILDESVKTPEGITIGSTLDEVLAAYGDNYTENEGQYTFTDGDAEVSILMEDGAAISVEYIAVNDLLN